MVKRRKCFSLTVLDPMNSFHAADCNKYERAHKERELHMIRQVRQHTCTNCYKETKELGRQKGDRKSYRKAILLMKAIQNIKHMYIENTPLIWIHKMMYSNSFSKRPTLCGVTALYCRNVITCGMLRKNNMYSEKNKVKMKAGAMHVLAETAPRTDKECTKQVWWRRSQRKQCSGFEVLH